MSAVSLAPEQTGSQRRLPPVWVSGVLIHVALGLYRIGRYDLLDDELFSVTATHHLTATLERTHGTMALYYLVLWPWARLDQGAVWMSLPSLIASCLAVGLLGALVARQAGRQAGQIASVLAGISFPIIQFSTIARSYSMWLAAVAAAWYFLDRCLEDPDDRRSHLGFAAAVLLMPVIHGMSAIGVVGLAVAVMIARPPRGQRALLLAPCAVALGVIAVLFLTGARRVGIAGDPVDVATARFFLRNLLYPGVRVSIVIVGIAVFGAVRLARGSGETPLARSRRVALALWGPVTAATTFAVLCMIPQSISGRYALPSALATAGLLAVAVAPRANADGAPSAPLRARRSWLAAGALVVGYLVGLSQFPGPNHEWSATFATVAVNAEPGDRIVFVPAEARLGYETVASDTSSAPTLAGPGGPLGTFDRFGSSNDLERTVAGIGQAPRVWLVVRHGGANDRFASDLLASPIVRDGYVRVQAWDTGPHVTVSLLIRRGPAGR